jgi:hypothetical protein
MKVNRSCVRPRLEWLSVSEGKSSISILAHRNELIVKVFCDGVTIVNQWVSFDELAKALLTLPTEP